MKLQAEDGKLRETDCANTTLVTTQKTTQKIRVWCGVSKKILWFNGGLSGGLNGGLSGGLNGGLK
ncbi:MAG: hypothetical protein KAT28_02385 [Candidatus Aenigmarchaeota archaeon]|nr:hypothetical protein [Candidatus Aenigmarchaeota archaeon]